MPQPVGKAPSRDTALAGSSQTRIELKFLGRGQKTRTEIPLGVSVRHTSFRRWRPVGLAEAQVDVNPKWISFMIYTGPTMCLEVLLCTAGPAGVVRPLQQ
jgi:hypothetical protein